MNSVSVDQLSFFLSIARSTPNISLDLYFDRLLFHDDYRVRHEILDLVKERKTGSVSKKLLSLYQQTQIREEKESILACLIAGEEKEILPDLWHLYDIEKKSALKLRILTVMAALSAGDPQACDRVNSIVRRISENGGVPARAVVSVLSCYVYFSDATVVRRYLRHDNPAVVSKAISVLADRGDKEAEHFLLDLAHADQTLTATQKITLLYALFRNNQKEAVLYINRLLAPGMKMPVTLLTQLLVFMENHIETLDLSGALLRKILIIRKISRWNEGKIISIFQKYFAAVRDSRQKTTELKSVYDTLYRGFERHLKAFINNLTELLAQLRGDVRSYMALSLSFIEEHCREEDLRVFIEELRRQSIPGDKGAAKLQQLKTRVDHHNFASFKSLVMMLRVRDTALRAKIADLLGEFANHGLEMRANVVRYLTLIRITGHSSFNGLLARAWKNAVLQRDGSLTPLLLQAMAACGAPFAIQYLKKALQEEELREVPHYLQLIALSRSEEAVVVLRRFWERMFSQDDDLAYTALGVYEHFVKLFPRTVNRHLLELLERLRRPAEIIMVFRLLDIHDIPDSTFAYSYGDHESARVRHSVVSWLARYHDFHQEVSAEPFWRLLYEKVKDPDIMVRCVSTVYLLKKAPTEMVGAFMDMVKGRDTAISRQLIETAQPLRSYVLAAELVDQIRELPVGLYHPIADLVNMLHEEEKQKIFRLTENVLFSEIKDWTVDAGEPEIATDSSSAEFRLIAQDMKRRTVFFIDITGYTAKSSRLSFSELLALLERFREIVVPTVEYHNGNILQRVGDCYMAIFPAAVQAAYAALKIQAALRDHNQYKLGDQQILSRIGLNTGPVIIKGDQIYGDTVNVASRMETNADPGSILVSQACYDDMQSKVVCEKLAPIRVKNKDLPIQVYNVLEPKDINDFQKRFNRQQMAANDLTNSIQNTGIGPSKEVDLIRQNVSMTYNRIINHLRKNGTDISVIKEITGIIHENWNKLNRDLNLTE